ncbi:sugar phosphate isomerase/epimerase family protein [Leucobacter celer]|uniref:sugar phosphate isomerase/epimerase family protein n=1 Tax=Leucobacter celer TaxID=668625 RepID=UPI0006A77B42|nr:sugar phosphate isomerase/epimerase family protein [Leucobacter celer]
MPDRIDLLATSWTSAGDAAPQRGDEVSPVPIVERIGDLVRAGWSGIGLVNADLQYAKREMGLPALREAIDQAGLRFREVEIIADWWTDGERRERADRLRDDLFEAAAELGAQRIKVMACLDESAPPRDVFVRELRELSRRAADAGVVLALEPMPFSSNVATLDEGVRLLEDVGHAAAGLTIDTWHVFRAGTPYERIPEIVPSELVAVVEINDCAAQPVGSLWADTVDNRRLPGQGDADTAEFVRWIAATGFTGPWGVEIISEELRNLPVSVGLERSARAAEESIRAGLARVTKN